MKLTTYCKSCSTNNTINSKGILLRQDLKEKNGEVISYQSKKCLQNNKVHPNQVYATISKLPLLICSIIGLAFIAYGLLLSQFVIWMFLIGGVFLTVGFYTTTISSNSKAFNKTFV